MAYIQVSTDGGFYTGDLYNLNPRQAACLWIIKSGLKSGAFRVLQSSDGNPASVAGVNYSTSADIITNSALSNLSDIYANNGTLGRAYIDGSMGNERSFYVVAPKAGATFQGQMLVSFDTCDGGQMGIRVKFSAGGFNALNPADLDDKGSIRTPTAITPGDEVYLAGGPATGVAMGDVPDGNTGNPPQYLLINNATLTTRFNMAVDDSVATPRAWCAMWSQGTDTTWLGLLWSYVTNLIPAPVNDTYPYVVQFAGPGSGGPFTSQQLTDQSVTLDATPAAHGFGTMRTGETTAKFSMTVPYGTGLSTSDGLSRNGGPNTSQNRDDMIPPLFFRAAMNLASPTGYKGTCTVSRWVMSARANGDMGVDTGTMRHVAVQNVWLPWVAVADCVR